MRINRKNDYAFKRIFGHEDTKDILAGFLTATLAVPILPEEITLLGTEITPEYLNDKSSRLDIQVRRSASHLMVVGDKDTFTPYNHHARLVLDGVPDKGKVRCGIVRNAGHFSFMNPFPDQRLGAQAARDPSGFDPEKFLEELNSEVLSFLSLTFAE